MNGPIKHIIFEGLPALGKSETLELLARFYPERVVVFPELVKEVATREQIDILTERERLTEALIAALPERREAITKITSSGRICLEESHLGVHYAYAKALGDDRFIGVYPKIERTIPAPDLFLRLVAPTDISVARQKGRNTPGYFIDGDTLDRMLSHLDAWHIARRTNLVTVDADRDPFEFIAEVERIIGLRYLSQRARVKDVFPIIFLLGRPASGKSEFIDFMKKTPLPERAELYHIGNLRVIDDFPILWEKFIEDDIWEQLGRGRLFSRLAGSNYAVADPTIWAFLIEKLNRLGEEALRELRDGGTLLIEFARGGEDGYRSALSLLSPEILKRASILYVDVSFEESWRRNQARYDEARRDSILTHSVPHEDLEKTYGTDDWKELTRDTSGRLRVNGFSIPYVTMKNEPESKDPAVLGPRYRASLKPLYELWRQGSG